jgi:uncharacterized protein
MRHHQAFQRALEAFALLAMLAGCASKSPALYTIAIQPGPTVAGGPKTVELHDIGLAGYLDRPAIVRSSDAYRMEVMANDMWGESLGAMIGRVLAEELAQRLPGSTVFGERGAISLNPDATVAINIQRMDIRGGNQLVLLAQVTVESRRRKDPAVKTFSISKPVASNTIPDEVAAISAAIGELADGLALMLRT